MFKLSEIKSYNIANLYHFRANAMLSQGNGYMFSQMLENRIDKIGVELKKRGEILN